MSTNSRGFSAPIILIILALVALLTGLGYFIYNKPAVQTSSSPKSAIESAKPSQANTPGNKLENEATSIQLESVESGFTEIDKDLKELK